MSGAKASAAAAAKCRGVPLAPPAAASAQQPQPEYWAEDDIPLMTLAAMHHLAAERRAAAAAAVEAMPPPPARGAWGSGGGDAAELRLWQLHELLIARASVGVGSAAALMADVELLAAVLVSGADPQQLQFAQLVTQWRPVDKLRQQVTDGVLHPEQAHARLHSLLRVTALPEVQQLFGQPQALQRTREQLAAAQTVFSRPA